MDREETDEEQREKGRKVLLGTVTIGQSPRRDLVPEMQLILGEEVEIVEAGALDGLSYEEIRGMAPQRDDYVLVTKMADGREVKVAERHILPRMQAQIDGLVQKGADVVALLCTGEFPAFNCPKLLIEPQKVLGEMVRAVASRARLGILIPDGDQVDQAYRRWKDAAREIIVHPASPYGSTQRLDAASREIANWGADLVAMDCMGYTGKMKEKVRAITGVPVILARAIVARVIKELLV